MLAYALAPVGREPKAAGGLGTVPSDEVDEAEPSLGWVGIGQDFHGMALPGYADDRELVDEDGGNDNGIADADGLNEQMGL